MNPHERAASRPIDAFRSLHVGTELLVLANCWDAGSARLIEATGAKALATTSAGIAWTHGFPDGDALPLDHLVGSVRAILRATRLPLTVDMEGGYGGDPASVAEAVVSVASAGAVGINIEDGASSSELLAKKIARVKQTASRRSLDLFVNARTDVYLRGLVPDSERLEETIMRARCYREAGADGIFVPGVIDRTELRALSSEVGIPLNVLAWPGLPAAAELTVLGVRRLSAGSSIAQAVLARTTALTHAFLDTGQSEPLFDGASSYAELNALFSST